MNPAIAESLPVISLVVVGFLLKMVKVLKVEDGALFSKLLLNITLPSVIFLSISKADVEPAKLLLLALFGFLIAMVLRLISGGAARLLKLEDSVAGVVILCSMVMNVGSLMYPVVQTVFGAEGISRTAAFDIGNSLMASGYGYYIATRFGSRGTFSALGSLKKVFSVPVIWAVLIGFSVNLLGITLPVFLVKLLTPLAAANAPLAMIALGVFVNFKFPKWKLMAMTVFFRMGLGFLTGLAIVLIAHLQGLDRTVVLMASAMPSGMVPLVYASAEGLDTEFAAACISLSIVIGVIITPLLLTI